MSIMASPLQTGTSVDCIEIRKFQTSKIESSMSAEYENSSQYQRSNNASGNPPCESLFEVQSNQVVISEKNSAAGEVGIQQPSEDGYSADSEVGIEQPSEEESSHAGSTCGIQQQSEDVYSVDNAFGIQQQSEDGYTVDSAFGIQHQSEDGYSVDSAFGIQQQSEEGSSVDSEEVPTYKPNLPDVTNDSESSTAQNEAKKEPSAIQLSDLEVTENGKESEEPHKEVLGERNENIPNEDYQEITNKVDKDVVDAANFDDTDDASQENDLLEGSFNDGSGLEEDRIACIEEEFVQRISILEQRHIELDEVLARLTSAIEISLSEITADTKSSDAEGGVPNEEDQSEDDGNNESSSGKELARKISFEAFMDFQQKIRQFATDLNGVMSCSEAAIRHARVVQEWATSVQMMFEQIKEERQKIMNYIDERERNMFEVKEQFVEELQEQGKQLQLLVEEMKGYREMRERGEEYIRSREKNSEKTPIEESLVDIMMKRRMDEEKSIILSLSKQSKISEMKLFIIHQQNCIQQLQEQNRELKAIIEGLMGPDELEDDDTDLSGTPASQGTPDRCPVREVLDRQGEDPISLMTDVLYCDRGEFLPGTSTDGDLAMIQTYGIGQGSDKVDEGEKVVFDPLEVNYVREQCRLAEESERQAHASRKRSECGEYYAGLDSDSDSDVEVIEIKDNVTSETELIEQSEEPTKQDKSHEAAEDAVAGDDAAAGDSPNFSSDKMKAIPSNTEGDFAV